MTGLLIIIFVILIVGICLKNVLFTGACFGILKIFTLMNVCMLAKECIEIKADIIDLNCVHHLSIFYRCFRSIKALRVRCVSMKWK